MRALVCSFWTLDRTAWLVAVSIGSKNTASLASFSLTRQVQSLPQSRNFCASFPRVSTHFPALFAQLICPGHRHTPGLCGHRQQQPTAAGHSMRLSWSRPRHAPTISRGKNPGGAGRVTQRGKRQAAIVPVSIIWNGQGRCPEEKQHNYHNYIPFLQGGVQRLWRHPSLGYQIWNNIVNRLWAQLLRAQLLSCRFYTGLISSTRYPQRICPKIH